MKRFKSLKEAKEKAERLGHVQADVTHVMVVDAMLEVNRDPSDGKLLYFLNTPAGRKGIEEKEAKELIEK